MSEFVMVKRELLECVVKTCAFTLPEIPYQELRAVLAQEAGKCKPVAWMTECIKGVAIGSIEQSSGPGVTKNMEYWTPDFPVYRQPVHVGELDPAQRLALARGELK